MFTHYANAILVLTMGLGVLLVVAHVVMAAAGMITPCDPTLTTGCI